MIILKRPKNVVAIYLCPVCRTAYTTEKEAEKCAATPLKTRLKPGDMVIISEGYGWSQNPEWVARKGVPFHGPTHDFWFIVTAITPDHKTGEEFYDNRGLHRAIIHVATGGANINPETGFRTGWTTDDGSHRGMELRKRFPKALYESAKHLIGQTSDHLL